ncbi:hypothetical protein [Enterocloster lavalensis]|uniref:hypothetical protein n=1 Tax=Enterocloster lavalensis TaxID=460384 RepID=UPI001D07E75E|nr:hypothetical protein [Enterocloster lavalensis]
MKKQLKRIACFAMAVVIGMSVAFPARADAVPVSLSPSSYVLSLLLNSMGVDVSLSSLASWCGVTETYEEFCDLGAKDQLSAWEQWCYNQGQSEGAEALRESYNKNVGWLSSLGWDVTVPTEDLSATADSMEAWLKSMPTYGTEALSYTMYRKAYSVPVAEYTCYPNLMFRDKLDYLHYVVSSESDVYLFFVKHIFGQQYRGGFYALSIHPFVYGYIDRYGDLESCVSLENSLRIGGVSYTYYRYYLGSDSYGRESTGWLPYEYVDLASDRDNMLDEIAESFLIAQGAQELNTVYAQTLPAQKVNPLLAKAASRSIRGVALPVDSTEAEEKLKGVNLTDDVQSILKSLLSAGLDITVDVDIPDESETTDETTTDDTDKKVITSLGQIIEKLEAIPKAIASFFTLDMAAIETAFKELQSVFNSKFDVLAKLVNIFKDTGRTFSDTPPVFKMQTPDCLRFAIHEDYITVLDLTGYKDLFFWVRGIMAASIWFAFSKWLLDQFDVKFHIG